MKYDIEDGEWEVSPLGLELTFAQRGWCYDLGEIGVVPPNEYEIRDMLEWLVNKVMEDGRPSASERMGRLLAIRHDNGPEALSNSVDLYLNIGYVWAFENEEDITND